MRKLFCIPFLVFTFVSCIRSENEVATLSPEVKAKCMICHDNGEMQRGPVINGLQTDYMLEQIIFEPR